MGCKVRKLYGKARHTTRTTSLYDSYGKGSWESLNGILSCRSNASKVCVEYIEHGA